ncbi:MAG: helix-turn-helix transcriptional regulator [Candidatus Krumholzibacteriia bacterium]
MPPAAPVHSLDLLSQIGVRVRRHRQALGESRSKLAVRSGVSVRFLAQLESGEANISILRLQEVAQALGRPLSEFLDSPSTATPAASGEAGTRLRIDALLRDRTSEELVEVLDWLAARFAATTGPLVALLGLRGAGKSSVGRRLAQALDVGFYELDALIEEAAGLPLEQVFELQGQACYRRLERETLAQFLASTPKGVLATGGGIVTEPETFALLRRRCFTVWLRAEPEDHWDRVVSQGDQRPMRGNPAAMQELRSLLAARDPLYSRSHITVDTSCRSVADVVGELGQTLVRHRNKS